MNGSAVVERGFKLKFGLKFCLLTTAGFLALTLFLYFATSRDLGRSYGEAVYTIYSLKINIFSLIFASFYSIAILVFIAVLIALISVFFSHKMAGPIYRVERNFDRLSSGDLTVVTKFRDSDQLAVVAEEKNRMTRSFNHMVRGAADALADIKRCEEKIGGLLRQGRGQAGPEMKEALEELRFSIEELKRVSDRAKTGE